MKLHFVDDDPDSNRWRVADENGDEVGEIWWAGPGYAWETRVPPAPSEEEARRRAEIARGMLERVYENMGTPTVEIRQRRSGSWEWMVLYHRNLPTREVALEELSAAVLATHGWKSAEG